MTNDSNPANDVNRVDPVDGDGEETEIENLQRRLAEAESTLAALRMGEVDAVVVDGPRGQQVFSLESADHPFRVFIERMEEGAVTIAEDGAVTYSNAFFARLVDVPLDRVIGAQFADLVIPADVETYEALLRDGMRGPSRATLQLKGAGGAPIRTSIAFSPLPTRQPRTAAVVVSDRSTQDKFERLEAARATAEAANFAKDQFLAMLGHELRTPLNAIVGWSQLLREKVDDRAIVIQGLETIVRNAHAQSKLLEDLLDVSRIMSGKLRLERGPVDLVDTVRSALESIAPNADAKKMRVTLAPVPQNTTVDADAARLEQVVWNVLSNAVKFTPSGGRVEVKLHVTPTAVDLIVSDTGQGIDAEFLPFVFESFRQANARATTRTHGGLGLGLSITREIVGLHGGSVFVHSDGIGKGATFTISLPRFAAPVAIRRDNDAAKQRGKHSLAGVKFLVVDDDHDALEFMRRLLTDHGARVAVASSADEALDLVDTFDPNILLSDVAMPHRDGYDLIRTIRAGGKNARTLPAIALTAFAGAEERRLLLAAGFQHHLPKPIDLDEVVKLLARLAGHTDRARAGDA